jgi:hypothetical protein
MREVPLYAPPSLLGASRNQRGSEQLATQKQLTIAGKQVRDIVALCHLHRLQGYLAHKIPFLVGPYSSPMPRDLC